MRHALAIVPALSVLAACTHTPVTPPRIDNVDSRWEAGLAQPDGEMPADWWTRFNDPVLDAMIADAQQTNVDVRLAAERVLGSQALRRGARADLFPELTGEAQVTEMRRGSASRGGVQGGGASVGISAAWEPDLSGRLSAAVRVASANVAAAQADMETVRLLLLQDVASSYVDYRLQRAMVGLTQRTASAQEATLRVTRDRHMFGMVGPLDVRRGETLVAQTRAAHERAVESAATARYRLAYLLATTSEDISRRLGEGDGIPAADPLEILASPASVLERRPDVRAAAARYAAAAGERDAARALRLPLLSLSGLVGLDAGSVSSLFEGGTDVMNLAASLVMPVFDFGRRRADVDAANSRLRQAGLEYEGVVREALRETQTAIIAFIQAQAIERELARAAQAARQAEQISMEQYRAGTLSQFEVLDAARTVYQAQSEHAAAAASVSTRLIILYRALGSAPDNTRSG